MASNILVGVQDATWETNTAQSFSMWALLYQGRITQLNELQPARFELSKSRNDLFAQLNFGSRVLVAMYLASGNPTAASDLLERQEAFLPENGFFVQHHNFLLARCQLELHQGRPSRAWEIIKKCWSKYRLAHLHHIEQVRVDFWVNFTQVALARYAIDLRPAVRTSLMGSLRTLKHERNPWAAAQVEFIGAALSTLDDDVEEALIGWQAAQSAFRELTMDFHALAARYCYKTLLRQKPIDVEEELRQLGFSDPKTALQTIIPPCLFGSRQARHSSIA